MPGEESGVSPDAACKARLAAQQSRFRGRCLMGESLRFR
jgi:hypothetical protein